MTNATPNLQAAVRPPIRIPPQFFTLYGPVRYFEDDSPLVTAATLAVVFTYLGGGDFDKVTDKSADEIGEILGTDPSEIADALDRLTRAGYLIAEMSGDHPTRYRRGAGPAVTRERRG